MGVDPAGRAVEPIAIAAGRRSEPFGVIPNLVETEYSAVADPLPVPWFFACSIWFAECRMVPPESGCIGLHPDVGTTGKIVDLVAPIKKVHCLAPPMLAGTRDGGTRACAASTRVVAGRDLLVVWAVTIAVTEVDTVGPCGGEECSEAGLCWRGDHAGVVGFGKVRRIEHRVDLTRNRRGSIVDINGAAGVGRRPVTQHAGEDDEDETSHADGTQFHGENPNCGVGACR